MDELITIEVAYATPERQLIKPLQVPEGTTARQAAECSGLDQVFPELSLSAVKLGIFGKAVADQQVLLGGDRVELYRPLMADPKAARKARADKKSAS